MEFGEKEKYSSLAWSLVNERQCQLDRTGQYIELVNDTFTACRIANSIVLCSVLDLILCLFVGLCKSMYVYSKDRNSVVILGSDGLCVHGLMTTCCVVCATIPAWSTGAEEYTSSHPPQTTRFSLIISQVFRPTPLISSCTISCQLLSSEPRSSFR